MSSQFFRKLSSIFNESEEKQLYTLISANGKRQLNATPTRAKELARNLMMQQQLGNWFKLEDGEGNTVLKHGNAPAAETPLQKPSHIPSHITPGTEPNPEPMDGETEIDPEGEGNLALNDYIDSLRNHGEDEYYRHQPEKDITPQPLRIREDNSPEFFRKYADLITEAEQVAVKPDAEKSWKESVLAKYPTATFKDPRRAIPKDGSYHTVAIVDGKVVAERKGNIFKDKKK